MSRFERLSTDGGQLDGSGIDPKMCGVFKFSLIDLEARQGDRAEAKAP
jgi:hypothetical protein